MSKFLYGSICLTDIPKEHITVSQTNGKEYLNIAIAERKEKGKFGETHTVTVSILKDQKKPNDKPIYIGNLKSWERNTNNQSGGNLKKDDDLPF